MEMIEVIKQIEAEKVEIKAQIEKLEAIERELISFGLDIAAGEVAFKYRELRDKFNAYCDDIAELKKEIRRQKNQQRKTKKTVVEAEGFAAYWEAHDNGTYQAVCPYRAKDLRAAWLKGYNAGVEMNGHIDSVKFA